MPFTLKGILHRKEELNVRNTENGSFSTQNIVIKIRRFDSMTGEEMKANFVVLEASTPALVYQLGPMPLGTPVECSFFPVGAEYKDKTTGEIKYFSRDRLTAIKAMQPRTQQAAPACQAPAPQPAAPGYGGMPEYMRQGNVPAPTAADEPQGEIDDLPFV